MNHSNHKSLFEKVEQLPEDPILSLPIHFATDPHQQKANLGIGVYRDENGLPLIFPSVDDAEKELQSQKLNKEYQPIEGNKLFLQGTLRLIYGSWADSASGVQTIGGTGALRVGAEFLVKQGFSKLFLSNPTWPNHKQIFQRAGMTIQEYPYYNFLEGTLDFNSLIQSLDNIPPRSVVLLHAGCHNPTGVDFSHDQWKELSSALKRKQAIPFFDLAYQGLGGSLEEDAWPIRTFVEQGHELFVANSYSKNLGLYGERVGSLSWVTAKAISSRLMSQVKQTVRAMYSSPPLHGGRIVATLLASPTLKERWEKELEKIRLRTQEMRSLLIKRLNDKNQEKNFNFMLGHQGMFSLLGLSINQVEKLKRDYGIYLPSNGRISLPSVNYHNIDYIVDALSAVFQNPS